MKITTIKGDITKVQADAIVNAVGVGFGNAIGGGVAGDIIMAAGEELEKENWLILSIKAKIREIIARNKVLHLHLILLSVTINSKLLGVEQ